MFKLKLVIEGKGKCGARKYRVASISKGGKVEFEYWRDDLLAIVAALNAELKTADACDQRNEAMKVEVG